MHVPTARVEKVQTPVPSPRAAREGCCASATLAEITCGLRATSGAEGFMLVTRRGFSFPQTNTVEKSEAERAARAGLSHRFFLAHLPRVLRADGRAHRASDEQPGAGDTGRLRLHEHASQTPRRRATALHRRG